MQPHTYHDREISHSQGGVYPGVWSIVVLVEGKFRPGARTRSFLVDKLA